MRALAGLISVMSVTLLLATSGLMADATRLRPPSQRIPAPNFSLTDSTGTTITLATYHGRIVLLDFWATWCTGCKVEMPWYMEFQKKYGAQGLTSIGVAMDEQGWEKVRPYLKAHPLNYPIVLGNPTLAKPYQVDGLPVTFLIDRVGHVADMYLGIVVKAEWESEIRQLLHER